MENVGFTGELSSPLSPFKPKGYGNPMYGMYGLSHYFIYINLSFFIYKNSWNYPPYPPSLHRLVRKNGHP
jgi:hypothetical protein